MATPKNTKVKGRTAASRRHPKLIALARKKVAQSKAQLSEYLTRRPHRSFRRTRRRDYVRSLNIPGYWNFTWYVFGVIRSNAKLLASLALCYALLGVFFVGLSSQDAFTQFSDLLDETDSGLFADGGESAAQAGLLLISGVADSVGRELTQAQQVYAVLILLLTWLTTVWLLRSILAGNKPRLRDGLYNAGAPIVVTGIIFLVLLLQLLPVTLGAIVLGGAITTDLFANGFIGMVVTLVVILLAILSLYWAVSTVMALIISTLPGMYPWQALRTAGDVVVGRRLRLLLRILWLIAGNVIAWVLVMLPAVLLDRWLKDSVSFMDAVPLVPILVSMISSIIVVWSAAYMYLLYRKVVEDDASPA